MSPIKRRLLHCILAGSLANTFSSTYCAERLLQGFGDSRECRCVNAPYPPTMLQLWWDRAEELGVAPRPRYRWARCNAGGSVEVIGAPSELQHGSVATWDVLVHLEFGWPCKTLLVHRWSFGVPIKDPADYTAELRRHPPASTPNLVGCASNTIIFALYALLCTWIIDAYRTIIRNALEHRRRELELRRQRKIRYLRRKRRRAHLIGLLTRTCLRCRYDLRGSPNGHCPECGWQRPRSSTV